MSETNIFISMCMILFGCLTSFFGGLAIVNCTKYIYFVLHKEETQGNVVGYKTKATYVNDRKSHYYRYYPLIKYSGGSTSITTIAKDIQDATSKPYRIGEMVGIAYNPRYPEYMVISDNYKKFIFEIFPICISGIYLAVLHIVSNIFGRHWTMVIPLYHMIIKMILLSLGIQIVFSLLLVIATSSMFKRKSWIFAMLAPIIFLVGSAFGIY